MGSDDESEVKKGIKVLNQTEGNNRVLSFHPIIERHVTLLILIPLCTNPTPAPPAYSPRGSGEPPRRRRLKDLNWVPKHFSLSFRGECRDRFVRRRTSWAGRIPSAKGLALPRPRQENETKL
ncbi:hypothetical protein V6N13_094664 [Hibiscus sabdariffa]|uniref:Uncharacterized protein n=1 Tax=Hibiscus sabdariffa TaxID=183260 RepID=A0ABR2B9M5_9ROSI